jgi:hypothetical protein
LTLGGGPTTSRPPIRRCGADIATGSRRAASGPRPTVAITAIEYNRPCFAESRTEERTYAKLIAPLAKKGRLSGVCVDPIADLAVLGAPDNQARHEKALAWDDLIEVQDFAALTIGALLEEAMVWLRATAVR